MTFDTILLFLGLAGIGVLYLFLSNMGNEKNEKKSSLELDDEWDDDFVDD